MNALTKILSAMAAMALFAADSAPAQDSGFGDGLQIRPRYELTEPSPVTDTARDRDRGGQFDGYGADRTGDSGRRGRYSYNDGVLFQRPVLTNQGDRYSPYYGHEFGIARSKARRRASEERMDANRNKVYRHDRVAANRGKPRSYGPDVDPRSPQLTMRGAERQSWSEEEAMRAVLSRENGRPWWHDADLPEPPPEAPEGMQLLSVRDDYYYYRDGLFFMNEDGDFVEVQAPLGARVFELPEERERVVKDGRRYYQYEGTWYQRLDDRGQTVYEVVENPNAG